MSMAKRWPPGMAGVGTLLLLVAVQGSPSAQQSVDPAIRLGATDLGGVVTSVNGPEAGVWVIAETNDLPTKFARLPVAEYEPPRRRYWRLQVYNCFVRGRPHGPT